MGDKEEQIKDKSLSGGIDKDPGTTMDGWTVDGDLLVVGRMDEGRREDEVESWTGVEADDNVIRDARGESS